MSNVHTIQEIYEAFGRALRRYDEMLGHPMYHELLHLWRKSIQMWRKRGLPWMPPPLPFYPPFAAALGPRFGAFPSQKILYVSGSSFQHKPAGRDSIIPKAASPPSVKRIHAPAGSQG